MFRIDESKRPPASQAPLVGRARGGGPDLDFRRMPADGIDPAELETCLRVLVAAEALPAEHPDAVAVRRATAKLFRLS